MQHRLCSDCRYYKASKQADLDKCTREGAVWSKVDLVRGEHDLAFCEHERTFTSRPGVCGLKAQFWEPSEDFLGIHYQEDSHV